MKDVLRMFSMYKCANCGNEFTRKDNVVRHLRNVCNVTHSPQKVNCDTDQEQEVATSVHDNVGNMLDLMSMITSALSDQRRKWKKDFEKFKKEIKPNLAKTIGDETVTSIDDEDNDSTDEDNVSTD